MIHHDFCELRIASVGNVDASKCFAAGTEIRMFPFGTKFVQDIMIGDMTIGPDGQAREVLYTSRGNSRMIEFQFDGAPPVLVTYNHIMCFVANVSQKSDHCTGLICGSNNILSAYTWWTDNTDALHDRVIKPGTCLYVRAAEYLKMSQLTTNLLQPVWLETNHRITGAKDIGPDAFYGFEVDKDHLIVLKSGLVTHNSSLMATLRFNALARS